MVQKKTQKLLIQYSADLADMTLFPLHALLLREGGQGFVAGVEDVYNAVHPGDLEGGADGLGDAAQF